MTALAVQLSQEQGGFLRVLIYKRTHQGDPDKNGWFGHNGCMGKLRSSDFQAVIGIGGIGKEPIEAGIAGKLNWIGIGAHREKHWIKGGPVITFEHFRLFEENGKELHTIAPMLSSRFYSRHAARRIFSDSSIVSDIEHEEIEAILKKAKSADPSKRYRKSESTTGHSTKCNICR